MSIGWKFTSNYPKWHKDYESVRQNILYGFGLKWQEISSKLITKKGIVDTGRLRASLTFSCEHKDGPPINESKESYPWDFIDYNEDKNSVIVGSNVEYAAKQELGNKKGAFVAPAILDFEKDYREVAKTIMKKGK